MHNEEHKYTIPREIFDKVREAIRRSSVYETELEKITSVFNDLPNTFALSSSIGDSGYFIEYRVVIGFLQDAELNETLLDVIYDWEKSYLEKKTGKELISMDMMFRTINTKSKEDWLRIGREVEFPVWDLCIYWKKSSESNPLKEAFDQLAKDIKTYRSNLEG